MDVYLLRRFFFCKLTSSIFLKKNSKKFVDRNGKVVPLQCKT